MRHGKAAIVGVNDEMEHGGALIHPQLVVPIRATIDGRSADPVEREARRPWEADRHPARPQGRGMVVGIISTRSPLWLPTRRCLPLSPMAAAPMPAR